MSNQKNGGLFSCTNMCWIAGALFALAAGLILARLYGLSTLLSVIIALVLLVVIAWLLQRAFCTGMPEGHHTDAGGEDEVVRVAPEHLREIERIEEESLARKPEFNIAEEMRGEEAAADGAAADGAAAQAEAGAEAGSGPAAAPAPAPAPAAKAEAPVKSSAKKAPAKKATGEKPAKKPAKAAAGSARRPVAPDGKPELLAQPRGGRPDDLKMIKGVGPKLEKLLNDLGVWHFDQIASWRKKEVEWVDQHLEGFRGRIVRDEWIKQAKVLARGGSTEFANRVKKGKVYKD